VVAGGIAAGYFYPPVRLFAEKAVGRGTGCPLGQALDADRNIKLQIRLNGEIVRASQLLEKDPAGYHLFQTPKGVWDKEDVLLLKRDPNNSAADSFVMLKDGSQGVQAPLTTIDKVVEELKLPRVDYIKMDIEGAEARALTGAQSTIARYHPRLSISAEHLPDDAVKIPAVIRKPWAGYQMACGPCLETKDGHVRPDVLYFR
jgi:FkbM family methyltransferase